MNSKSHFVWSSVIAALLVACAADGTEPSEIEEANVEELGMAEQALGSVSHQLPVRGSKDALAEEVFHGYGMLYRMVLRSGALVDAVTTNFYTPSRPDNRFREGDAVFARGPTGGTAGSPQPALVCPAGYAAHGLYGRSGKRLDMLGLICARIGADGRPVVSDSKVIGAYGGNGGTFFLDTCGEGRWLGGAMFGSALKSSGSNKIISYVQGYCANAQ